LDLRLVVGTLARLPQQGDGDGDRRDNGAADQAAERGPVRRKLRNWRVPEVCRSFSPRHPGCQTPAHA
jgi:hypothetical protein